MFAMKRQQSPAEQIKSEVIRTVEAPAKPEIPEEFKLTAYQTDPDQEIWISEDNNIYDNKPILRKTTYRKLFEYVSQPDEMRRTKDGPGYLCGPCHGLRRQANIQYLNFAILDADASIDLREGKKEGAPHPREVHEALVSHNITHCLYTTYSHGAKGNRYRIIFPCLIRNKAELRGLMVYLCELLSSYDKIPIYLTPESITWGQRWNYPRLETADSPFYSASHFGIQVEPADLVYHYGCMQVDGTEARVDLPETGNRSHDPNTLIAQFCKAFQLPELLISNGYEYCGQGVILDRSGREIPTLRLRPAGSNSPPGVVLLEHEGRWRAYSHHTNDKLANGKLNDSYDYFFSHVIPAPVDRPFENVIVAAQMLQEHYLELMERNHPVIMDGGTRFRVGMLVDSEFGGQVYRLLKLEDFKNRMAKEPPVYEAFSDDTGELKVRAKARADWWRENPHRKSYDGTLFYPLPINETPQIEFVVGKTRYFNTFRGFGLTPKEGKCEKILWHIRNVLCSDIEAEYDYLLDWLAHLFQFPHEKPDVAVVMRSGKGTGKSIITSHLAMAMGELAMVFSHRRQLTGNFNGHFAGRLLAVFEEAFWAGSPEDEGPLKSLITEGLTTVEHKGVDAGSARSFIRVIMITNSEWAVPASADERRYFLPTISNLGIERQRREGDYFRQLAGELSSGGLQAFVHLLAHRPIDRTSVKTPPSTYGLHKQKMLSLSGLRAWLYDALLSGGLTTKQNGFVAFLAHPHRAEIGVDMLEDSAERYLYRGETNRSTKTRILSLLSDIYGPCQFTNKGGTLYIALPPLEEMRDRFAQAIGSGLEWDRLH